MCQNSCHTWRFETLIQTCVCRDLFIAAFTTPHLEYLERKALLSYQQATLSTSTEDTLNRKKV